jgi:hypothetical protein
LRPACTLIGVEQDPASFSALCERTAELGSCKVEPISDDFLDFFTECPLFGQGSPV